MSLLSAAVAAAAAAAAAGRDIPLNAFETTALKSDGTNAIVIKIENMVIHRYR